MKRTIAFTATLRKVGGSTMLALPAAVLEAFSLVPQARVELTIEDEAIVVRPARPRYSLEELIAGCEPRAKRSDEDRIWQGDGAVGKELL